MLFPKKSKFKKFQKGSLPNRILSFNRIPQFGTYCLKAISFGIFSGRQIEAGRKIIMKKVKRKGRLWVRVFPHIPVSKKPVETRMGKGKGSVDHWIFKVRPGMIVYEIEGISHILALEIFKIVSKKLPFFTKMSL